MWYLLVVWTLMVLTGFLEGGRMPEACMQTCYSIAHSILGHRTN